MGDGDREIGNILARLDHLEIEAEKAREKLHAHAGKLNVYTNLTGVIKVHDRKIASLEASRAKMAWVIGVVSGASVVLGAIAEHFAGKVMP